MCNSKKQKYMDYYKLRLNIVWAELYDDWTIAIDALHALDLFVENLNDNDILNVHINYKKGIK